MSNHYTYRAEWSTEDNEYVGLVAEFPSLSWLAETAAEAVAGAVDLVDGILADMAETGETPPAPFAERRYSGNLSFRTSPAQHRALAIEAAEQGVSVNQLLVYKTAGAGAAVAAAAVPPEPAKPDVTFPGGYTVPAAVVEHVVRTVPRVPVAGISWKDLPESVQSAISAQIEGIGAVALKAGGSHIPSFDFDFDLLPANFAETAAASHGMKEALRVALEHSSFAETFQKIMSDTRESLKCHDE
ncbi:type II toxin-antitoxin system HicB family antitoxin [Mycolicibacterium llatzerense]|uniref:type II toxin-antitoxin system HicB family antitoxin n=1 Tax=Mycolicibacterium llatzerense TaxID=280871 RepID=UPI0029FB2776|nr:hypothetical protein [Mycolicibacterium llatzerense]